MSRFYNALKEASRSQLGADGKSGNEADAIGESGANIPEFLGADAIGENGVSIPELLDRAEPVEEKVPASQPLDPVVASKPAVSEAAEKSGPPAPRGDHPKVVFDPSARVIPHAADSIVVEYYRRLRTKVLQQHAAKPFRTLVVTSPGPQEGKTVTVLNLGLSFAMLPDLKVLVIDGDLRRGSLGKWLRVGEHPGLSNLLDGSAKLEDTVLKYGDGPLSFLVRGTSPASPAELLHSMDLRKHFQHMEEQFDLVLVDSPPINLITDTQLLAACCDAVLLIARAFQTTRKAFEKAVQDLAPFRVIGTVLNGGTKVQPYRKYGGYYY